MDTKTKIWPEANEKGLGWTAKYPRPTEDGGHRSFLLADRQTEWDSAEALRQKYAQRADEIRSKREVEEQEKRDAAATKDAARQQAKRDELEAQLRRRFIVAGGNASEWDAQKDQIVADHLRQQTLTGSEDRARQAQSSLYRSF